MDREIKFQGNRLDDGQRVEGGIYQTKDGRVFIIEDTWTEGDPIHPGEIIRMFDGHEVDLKTVGQFTGRKDIRGKKIFERMMIEGDLFDSRLPIMGEVVYDEHFVCWNLKNKGGLTPLYKIYKIEIIDETEVSHGATDDG